MGGSYPTPNINFEFNIAIDVDNSSFCYDIGSATPMKTQGDAQEFFSLAVQIHEHVPINVLSNLSGAFKSRNRFEGTVEIADDLADGSDADPATRRAAPVTITCIRQRQSTVMEPLGT